MKTCYRCEEIKEITEFHKDRTSKDGHSFECKKCKSEWRKQKRRENPEHYREICRRSNQKNYERIRESQRKHLLENREKILKRRRELREPRKHELNAKEKERRKNDPTFLIKNRERYKKYYENNKQIMLPKHNAHKMVMYAIKIGIMQRPSTCEICNIEGKMEGHHEDYSKPLDVKWVCKACHKHIHKKIKG